MIVRRKAAVDNVCKSILKDIEHYIHLGMNNNVLQWVRTYALQSNRPDKNLKPGSGAF